MYILILTRLIQYTQARSSAKRKQLFLDIQVKDGRKPRQLLMDVSTRWSSTYVMLNRAEELKQVCCISDIPLMYNN